MNSVFISISRSIYTTLNAGQELKTDEFVIPYHNDKCQLIVLNDECWTAERNTVHLNIRIRHLKWKLKQVFQIN